MPKDSAHEIARRPAAALPHLRRSRMAAAVLSAERGSSKSGNSPERDIGWEQDIQQALRTREADLPMRPTNDALRDAVLGERSEDYLSAERPRRAPRRRRTRMTTESRRLWIGG